MFGNKKNKVLGNVLKLFKIISPKDLVLYNPNTIRNVIKLSLSSFYNDNIFNYVELNYGSKRYKNLTTFLDKLNNTLSNIEIVDLRISDSKDTNLILYSNELQNQIQKDDLGIVELSICSESNNINKDTAKIFVDKLIEIFPIDYGYIFPLRKNMDINTEKNIKKSLFSSSISVTKEDIVRRKMLFNINDGFLPQLYQINFLNQPQFDVLNNSNTSVKEIVDIKNKLKMVVVDNVSGWEKSFNYHSNYKKVTTIPLITFEINLII